MSEFSLLSLLNSIQNSISTKKEEINLLDYLINNFNKDSNISNEYSLIYNNLIENRTELFKEAALDFLYILKGFQTFEF